MVPLRKRFKRAARYFLLKAVVSVVALLPTAWASGLGRTLGRLAYRVVGGERRKALRSLAQAFPTLSEDERGRIAREAFGHLGAAACELSNPRRLDRELAARVEYPLEVRALMAEAVFRGKGIVYSTGHLGSWELLARSVGILSCEVHAVGRETSDPRTTQWVMDLRESANVRTIWRGAPGAARELLKVLRRGGLLAMLIDQDTRVQSVFVPFFGRPASTPRAAAELALRTGATLISGFCLRVGEQAKYQVQMKEIAFQRTDDWEADVVGLTARLTKDIEDTIRMHPTQWVWMHQRWKTQTAPLTAS